MDCGAQRASQPACTRAPRVHAAFIPASRSTTVFDVGDRAFCLVNGDIDMSYGPIA
jgi:hypothetical protein